MIYIINIMAKKLFNFPLRVSWSNLEHSSGLPAHLSKYVTIIQLHLQKKNPDKLFSSVSFHE